MNTIIAKRYAKALLDGDESKLDSYIDTLSGVSIALRDADIRDAIASPLIKASKKTEWIIEALGKDADSILVRLVEMMGEKGRLELIPEVASILNYEYKKKRNSYTGTIESANSLDEIKVKELESLLSKYSGAEIKLEQQVSDFSGLRAKVEDLGLELNFSKDRVKNSLLDYIQKAL